MGDDDVLAPVKDVLKRLNSQVLKEFGVLWGFKGDIQTLNNDLGKIEAILDDIKVKRRNDEAAISWLKSVRSATLMGENTLADVLIEATLQRLHKERGIRYRVRAFFSSDHNPIIFRVRTAHKAKVLRRKLDAIPSNIRDLRHSDVDGASEMPHRETRLFAPESSSTSSGGISRHVDDDMAGEMPDMETRPLSLARNEDKEIVIETICNKDIGKQENGEIRVYGILGVRGVGKTTLAGLVYNEERVKQYFEVKCWADVSEKFQVKELIKAIITSIDDYECTLTHLDVLQESLQNKLRGKKFLIVLDDILIEGKPKWDILSETLSCGAEGSIVLITTRSEGTCQMMAKSPELQHNLGCLSEEDSWLLFKKRAFAGRIDRDDIRELEPIGRDIAKMCNGLPLALQTLGDKLSRRSISYWQSVRERMIQSLDFECGILEVLLISYNNLRPHLKRCFAYCCLFPKGYEMEKDVVIQLWIVNGFIPPRGERDVYELGEGIIKYLVSINFFSVVNDEKHLNDKFILPGLVYNFALNVMGNEVMIPKDVIGDDEVIIPNEALHFCSSYPAVRLSPENLGKSTSLRSLFMFGKEYEFSISQNFNHGYLRVLYMCGIRLKELPESICKLKHLKYLNLSYSTIQDLPDSIIYLQNLQMLLLKCCYQLRKLPEKLRYVKSLRTLDITGCHSLVHLPSGTKEITKLQRLPWFHAGGKTVAKLGELGDLNCLEGKLEISGLENVGDQEAPSANLKDKTKLSVLKLSWSNYHMRESKREIFDYDKEVLEGLEPNPCLEELTIHFYMGNIISPTWMVKLSNLSEIGFSGCKRCERIPALGRLPSLRIIKLLGMDSLEGFHNDDMSGDPDMFPCLQELNIYMCPNLLSLPPNLPKLEIIKLEECGALTSLPDDIQGLEVLEISGCKHLRKRYGKDWPNVSSICKIRTDFPRKSR